MAISDGNIGFNDITQELYGRTPQVGDNLLQMFEDAPADGFDPTYDIGVAGPGDAMSEFRKFVKSGSVSGMWESHLAKWQPAEAATYPQSYFSSRGILLQSSIALRRDTTSSAPFNGPVTVSVTIGNVTVDAIGTFSSITDTVNIKIISTNNLDNGVYEIAKDVSVTLTDAGGFIHKASLLSVFSYLHIYGKGTGNYRWKWSQSSTDQYPIEYPQATWKETTPLAGSYPGQTPPAVNITISDLAGFTDITASMILKSSDGLNQVGTSDNLIGEASGFTANVAKKISFNADALLNYQDAASMIGYNWIPEITLSFAGGQLETSVTRGNTFQFFKVLTETSSTFQWAWGEIIADGGDTGGVETGQTIAGVEGVVTGDSPPEEDPITITTTTTTTTTTIKPTGGGGSVSIDENNPSTGVDETLELDGF